MKGIGCSAFLYESEEPWLSTQSAGESILGMASIKGKASPAPNHHARRDAGDLLVVGGEMRISRTGVT